MLCSWCLQVSVGHTSYWILAQVGYAPVKTIKVKYDFCSFVIYVKMNFENPLNFLGGLKVNFYQLKWQSWAKSSEQPHLPLEVVLLIHICLIGSHLKKKCEGFGCSQSNLTGLDKIQIINMRQKLPGWWFLTVRCWLPTKSKIWKKESYPFVCEAPRCVIIKHLMLLDR